MGNLFNQDFQELIQILNEEDVQYILVGGYAVILHGYHRTTGDLDIWLRRTESNYSKFIKASNRFGLPTSSFTKDKFLYDTNIDVFSFGRPPVGLDIMLELKGLDFETCYQKSLLHEIDGLTVRLINYDHLIEAKKSAGRPKDLLDIQYLEEE